MKPIISVAPEISRERQPRKTRKQPVHLTPRQVDDFFKVCKDPRDRAIFMVVYHRGLRASEAGLLQLSDWDTGTRRLFVRRLKGSNSLDYRLMHDEVQAIRSYLRIRGLAPGPLFLSREHRGIGRKQLHNLMRGYCAMAGIPAEKAHMHAWKHTTGTELANNGIDLLSLQEWLGHKNPQNTQLYIALSSSRRDRVADKVDQIYARGRRGQPD